MITAKDIAWIAGFLEGEGSFCVQTRSIEVRAAQKQREPLDRLQKLLGGSVNKNDKHHPDMHLWVRCGSHAAGIMMTIYGMMSPRRKTQILKCLDFWKSRPVSVWYKAETKNLPRGSLGHSPSASLIRKHHALCVQRDGSVCSSKKLNGWRPKHNNKGQFAPI